MSLTYGSEKKLSMPFDEAVSRVTAALAAEGFGILSDIDVAAALKKKLNADVPPYRILGACNPPLAQRAIAAEPAIGLLLPCNVLVRQDAAGDVYVGIMDVHAILGLVNRPEVAPIGEEAGARLERVMAAL